MLLVKIIKVIVLLFLLFGLYLIFSILLKIYKAPLIDNPITFTKNFRVEGQKEAYPGHGEGFSIIGDVVGYNKSPLFPYSSIDEHRTVVNHCDPSYKEIYVDSIWKVFFIGIMPDCSIKSQRLYKFYGPYRTTANLENL